MLTQFALPGGREVGLVRHFTQRGVQTEATDTVTVLGERLEDDSLVDVPPGLERTAVLGVEPRHLAGVLGVDHTQLRVLVDVTLQHTVTARPAGTSSVIKHLHTKTGLASWLFTFYIL